MNYGLKFKNFLICFAREHNKIIIRALDTKLHGYGKMRQHRAETITTHATQIVLKFIFNSRGLNYNHSAMVQNNYYCSSFKKYDKTNKFEK